MPEIKKILFGLVLSSVFLIVAFAGNRSTGSDPRAALLVSQAIMHKGTVKLDHYGSDVLDRYGYAVHIKNGHYYYYFPIGTSIASIPFVAVANGIGLDMTSSESAVQIFIAAVVSMFLVVVLYKLASLFLSEGSALLVSSLFWFGTSLSSTGGTALWSHNFATLFALLSVYPAVRAAKLKLAQPWLPVAVFLFAAYLCRPTMALLSPVLLFFLFSYSKVSAIKSGLVLASLLALFSLFSAHEFGQLLPDYYLPKRLTGAHFHEALYGNLLSPARGILVYSPFLVVVWLCFKYSQKNWGLKKSWFLIGLAWPVLHLIFVSRYPHWWAGWSYGARFMTDVLPGLFLLTLRAWPTNFQPWLAKMLTGVLLASCAFAAIINAGQGLFNKFTATWNADPNIDRYPEYLFDWSYPQFLANENGHTSRLVRHGAGRLQSLSPGDLLDHRATNIIYSDWHAPESAHRWSDGKLVRLIFKVNQSKNFEGVLRLHLGTLGPQKITVQINGLEIYAGKIDDWDKILDVPLNSQLKDGVNTITFELPEARRPGADDPRILAIALKSFQLR